MPPDRARSAEPVRALGLERIPRPEECVQMSRDGYLVVRNFFAPGEAAQILRWTAELERAPEVTGRHWVYREDSQLDGRRIVQRIENFCPYHAQFDGVVRAGALVRWAGALMGGPVVLFKEKINYKLPGGSGFKVHQDQQAGWSRYAPIFLTAMVTLDAATLANGCLEIAPGRHREDLLGEEWAPLAEKGLALRPVPTNPGDVVFFDSFAPHASKPNLTSTPRRILYLTYNLAEHGDHRERYYADKHAAFPPDIDREAGKAYVFRV